VLVVDILTHRLHRTATDLERNIIPMLDVVLKLSTMLIHGLIPMSYYCYRGITEDTFLTGS